MKYSITINQLANYENGLGLDLIDLALFDFVQSFVHSGRCECISMDNKPYFWISPQYVISEMPILGIKTTRGINLRIENLINAGMLIRGPENQSKRKTYLAFGPKVGDYEFSTWNDDSKSLGTSVPRINNTNDNNNIYNNTEGCLFDDSVHTADGVAAASHQSNKPNKHYIDQRRVKVPPSGDIETRDAQFKAWCFEYLGEFDEGLITDLYLKYSQPDRQGKLLFELEKSWDMHKRLLYWKRCREKGFNRYPKNNAQAVEPEHKEISAQEALKRAGWI